MQPAGALRGKLHGIDGRDYGALQALKGRYQYDDFQLIIEQIPKDPYAPPHTGIYRVVMGWDKIGLGPEHLGTKIEQVACRDYFARRFHEASAHVSTVRRGTGFSGLITIDTPSQAILERSSVVLDNECLEVRCFLGLPADGRKINGPLAIEMLLEELPQIVKEALLAKSFDAEELTHHIQAAQDAVHLRAQLDGLGLVAFVANGAILPRISGTSQRPLDASEAVEFEAPAALSVEMELPSGKTVNGMGIPKGVTLFAGGGYHGKSTLLEAIEQGIYNHIRGDGREQCVTASQTIKIRAYSGRYVNSVDISPFIGTLPFGKNTTSFSTQNASGSTSQAASIAEAIEVGAQVLMMDEDTCATNFMIRDRNMQQLVQKQDEPITAFIDRVKKLHTENGISTILVLGGVGDYFKVADTVIQLREYTPHDVTAAAKAIIERSPSRRVAEQTDVPVTVQVRVPDKTSIDPYNEYKKKAVFAKETKTLHFGRQNIDLTDIEQLIDLSQTKAIGQAIIYATRYMDGAHSLEEVVRRVMENIDERGLDILSDRISGHFAAFPGFALAAALNRMRGFETKLVNTR